MNNNFFRQWNRQFTGAPKRTTAYKSLPRYSSPMRKKANSLRRKSLAPPKKPGFFSRIFRRRQNINRRRANSVIRQMTSRFMGSPMLPVSYGARRVSPVRPRLTLAARLKKLLGRR
jgi:hypothetical protein